MRYFAILPILTYFIVISFGLNVQAQSTERLAQCDLCGYCQGQPPPEDWKQCRDCIYPNASENPKDNDSLRITENVDRSFIQVTPRPGTSYTMIGCLNTNFSDFNIFSETNSAGTATTPIINRILQILFSIVGALAFLYLLYGAYVLMTSRDNPERVSQGRNIVIGSIIGVVFSLSVTLIVNFIGSGILRIPGLGNERAQQLEYSKTEIDLYDNDDYEPNGSNIGGDTSGTPLKKYVLRKCVNGESIDDGNIEEYVNDFCSKAGITDIASYNKWLRFYYEQP